MNGLLNDTRDSRALMNVALGNEKADLAIVNAKLVNVYTAEILNDVAVSIKGKWIAYVGNKAEHTIGPDGQPEKNGACAHGNDPFGLPASWGRGKMHWQVRLKYKEPGSSWTHWFDGAKVKYHDTGQVESNVMCWVDNVLGEWSRRDLSLPRYRQFPTGTQLLIETDLSYWIKALGVDSSADVGYSLDVLPYINLESCSYQYPEWITIHVPDYL